MLKYCSLRAFAAVLMFALSPGCDEIRGNMELNELARELDYGCFSKIDSTGVVSASAESTFYPDHSEHLLIARVLSAESNMRGEYPESLVLDCSVDLYQSMPSPFTSLLIDVQFGRDENNMYRTRIYNDTVFYTDSGLGFPIDSILETDFNRHLY